MTDLEAVMLEDTRVLLARWRREFAGRPGAERERLLMLALEREQIVAVAYREEAVAGRVAALDVGEDARAVIRQTLVWIWKDEQLHAEYIRGALLRAKRLAATSNHLRARAAPFRAGAAGLLVAFGGLTGQVPPVLGRELRYQTFRHY